MKRGVFPQLIMGFMVVLMLIGFVAVLTGVVNSLSISSDNATEGTIVKGMPVLFALIVLGGALYSIQRGLG